MFAVLSWDNCLNQTKTWKTKLKRTQRWYSWGKNRSNCFSLNKENIKWKWLISRSSNALSPSISFSSRPARRTNGEKEVCYYHTGHIFDFDCVVCYLACFLFALWCRPGITIGVGRFYTFAFFPPQIGEHKKNRFSMKQILLNME